MAWKASFFNAFRFGGVIPEKYRNLSTVVGLVVCAVAGILATYHAAITVEPMSAALFLGIMVVMGMSLVRSGEESDE